MYRDLLGELEIIMNFNDHTVTWDTDTIPMKDRNMNIPYLFDGTLGEFNMEPIILQLMDPNCKPIHARAYTIPRSVEQQLQQSKEIVRLVDIGVLEED
jgi:hypothetical protein